MFVLCRPLVCRHSFQFAANAWKAVAELLSQGLDALPHHVGWAMLVAMFVGIALPIVNRKYANSK